MLALAKSSHYTVEFSPHLRPTTINNRQLFVCSAGDQVDALTKKSGPSESLKLKSLILLNALLIQLVWVCVWHWSSEQSSEEYTVYSDLMSVLFHVLDSLTLKFKVKNGLRSRSVGRHWHWLKPSSLEFLVNRAWTTYMYSLFTKLRLYLYWIFNPDVSAAFSTLLLKIKIQS